VTRPPEQDLADLAEATERLLADLGTLDDATARSASLLPGWSVGHVLTHLARNADGMVRLVEWAQTGVPAPMYASREARVADIEGGAGRPAEELVADVRGSAARLAGALDRFHSFDDAQLDRLILFGPPRPDAVPDLPAYSIPSARIRELEIHHVDLGLPGYTPLDWPDDFVERTLLAIHASSGPVDVLGHPAEVLAWRLGRGAGPTVLLRDGSVPGEPPPWM
jgi:maleylpyruvate isomerase